MARPRKITAHFAKVRQEQRRLVDWMRAHHADLQAELGGERIDWRAAMVVIADLKLTDEHGQAPSRDTVARTWARVCREVVVSEVKRGTIPAPILDPGQLAPGVHWIIPPAGSTTASRYQPPVDVRPARPRSEASSSGPAGSVPSPSVAAEQKPVLDGSPEAQAADGATEQIRAALTQLGALRVPMPKRVS